MARLPPADLVTAAHTVLTTLESEGIAACLIGGMVVSRWGQPRATTDADISALAPYGEEGRVVDLLLAHFDPRSS
jgi:hypothetical protein